MVLPMFTNAGLSPKSWQLWAKISRTLPYCEASIVAGTPGAYDFSQGISIVLLSSTIVAIASSVGASGDECNPMRRARRAPYTYGTTTHEETPNGQQVPQERRHRRRPIRRRNARFGAEDLARRARRLRARQERGPAHVRGAGRAGKGPAQPGGRGGRPGAQDGARAGGRGAGQVGQARAGVRGPRLALAQSPRRAHQPRGGRPVAPGGGAEPDGAQPHARAWPESAGAQGGEEGRGEKAG